MKELNQHVSELGKDFEPLVGCLLVRLITLQYCNRNSFSVVMVALCNRADHYIFIL